MTVIYILAFIGAFTVIMLIWAALSSSGTDSQQEITLNENTQNVIRNTVKHMVLEEDVDIKAHKSYFSNGSMITVYVTKRDKIEDRDVILVNMTFYDFDKK